MRIDDDTADSKTGTNTVQTPALSLTIAKITFTNFTIRYYTVDRHLQHHILQESIPLVYS